MLQNSASNNAWPCQDQQNSPWLTSFSAVAGACPLRGDWEKNLLKEAFLGGGGNLRGGEESLQEAGNFPQMKMILMEPYPLYPSIHLQCLPWQRCHLQFGHFAPEFCPCDEEQVAFFLGM